MPPFQLLIDPVLLRDQCALEPRYQSYPTCDFFVEAFGETDVRERLRPDGLGRMARHLSLYLHLPFCEESCRYAGCRKIVARPGERLQKHRLQKYLKCLAREVALAGELGAATRGAAGLHWRCAVPESMQAEQLAGVTDAVRRAFAIAAEGAWVIDIEASRAQPGRIREFGTLGFNEVSIQVSDGDGARAREALGRSMDEARRAGFRSTHLEIAYASPRQALDRFSGLLELGIEQAPETITLRVEKDAARVASVGANLLLSAGYLHLGFGSFVRPESALASAKRQGRLQYGPAGFSAAAGSDVLGFGMSAIAQIGSSYWQNPRTLDGYCTEIEKNRLPVWRGLELGADDLVRRAVIHGLICNCRVSIEAIERAHLIDFQRYFSPELEELQSFAERGLIDLSADWLVVAPQGKLLVGTLCEVFDRRRRAQQRRFAGTPL